ncbi:hypothetical protein TDB9533_00477 [Thalassocella blandensis]|nr:hypothetical protein TDB9533_00477 [Thalassocella blandensis]
MDVAEIYQLSGYTNNAGHHVKSCNFRSCGEADLMF